jgi:hypothetical protein
LPPDLELPEGTHLSKPFTAAALLQTLQRVLYPEPAPPA